MAICYNFITPPVGLPKCTTEAFPLCKAGDRGKYKCPLKYTAIQCVFLKMYTFPNFNMLPTKT